jgi:hypothetical protein
MMFKFLVSHKTLVNIVPWNKVQHITIHRCFEIGTGDFPIFAIDNLVDFLEPKRD